MPHFADRIREMGLKEKRNKIDTAQGNTHMVAVYGSKKGKSQRKDIMTARGKENQNHQKKKRSGKEQFPSFAVSFKSNDSSKVEEKNKETKRGKMKFWETKKLNSPQEALANFHFPKDSSFGKSKKKSDEPESLPAKKIAFNKYLKNYNQALDKIFRCLDIFNRGRISQANINKWIPQSALYFLGSVFQKMRQERLALTKQHFLYLCQPVMYVSGEEDLKAFIEDVNGKQSPLDVSIEVSSPEKVSVVIGRASQERQNSSRRPLCHTLQVLASQRKALEKQDLGSRLGSMQKQQARKVQLGRESGIEMEGPPKSKREVQPGELYNSKVHHSRPKKPTYREQIQSLAKQVFSNQKQNSESKDSQPVPVSQPIQPVSFHPSSPYFTKPDTLQVPEHYNQRYSTRNIFNQTFNNISLEPPARKSLEPHSRPVTERPSSSAAMRTSQILLERCASARQPDPASGKMEEKVDRLSSRLEQYLRLNKEKIERNAKFIRQNSRPKQ